MLKNIVLFLFVIFSTFFLYSSNTTIFLGSTFLFFALSGMSFLVIVFFFFIYFNYFVEVVSTQLNGMQKVNSVSWHGWFSENINEFSTLFLVATPYVIGFVGLANGLSVWFPMLSILPILSIGVMVICSALMTFLLITVTYNWIYDRKRTKEYNSIEVL